MLTPEHTAPAAPTVPDPPIVSVRQVAFALVAVVVLQVLFAVSYLATFHNPTPHKLTVAVAAPTAEIAQQTVTQIRTAGGKAFDPQTSPSPEAAHAQVQDREAVAAFVVGINEDELVVASAAGPSQSLLLTTQFRALEAKQQRTLIVTDVAPLPKADSRGLAPFYITLVMVFGGYLGVTVLSLVTGPAASRGRNAAKRMLALALYSILSAIAVVLTCRATLGVLDGHEVQAVAAAAFICFATCATAVTLQALLGAVGTGLIIIVFVIIGNPAAGGALPYGFEPEPYRTIGGYLVNGAGVDLLRNLTYFDGSGLLRPLLVLAVWAGVGALGAVTVGARRFRRLSAAELELAPALAAGL